MPRHRRSYGRPSYGRSLSTSHLTPEQKEIVRNNSHHSGGKRRSMRSKTSKKQKRRTRKNRRHTRKH